jgi:hypothetical protein
MTATSRTPPPVRARTDAERPAWFRAFLTDRATRKPSPHTLHAYRQDFDAIARIVADDPQQISALTPRSITKDSMRQVFAAYAESHEAASIRRCWSTWNTLCCYLFTADLLPANPMELVGRPKLAKALPKSLPSPPRRRSSTPLTCFPVPRPLFSYPASEASCSQMARQSRSSSSLSWCSSTDGEVRWMAGCGRAKKLPLPWAEAPPPVSM